MTERASGERPARQRLAEWATDSALNLAVFRIAVGCVLLMLPDLHAAPRFAALPDAVRTAPIGLEWTLGRVPIDPSWVAPAYWVVVAAIALGVVGFATRAAWATVALVGLPLLAVPQYVGSVFHYHHLWWFAVLLAVSPSGDALSIDRWIGSRRGRPPPAPSLAYGVPIRAAWLLIGVVFFFPGLHKLIESGPAWIFSDNLRNQMYAKWFQMRGFEPVVRIDRYPWLVRAGALGTVAFELSFFALALHRRTRLLGVAIAMFFHQATAYLMGLRFPALWITYVVFVDWSALARWARQRLGRASEGRPAPDDAERPDVKRAPRLSLAVAATLLAGATFAGALGVSDAWPFACYPKFHRVVGATLPELRVELIDAEGVATRVPVEAMNGEGPTQRWWAMSWSLMGSHERARADPERWRAFWRRIRGRPAVAALARDAVELRFVRDYVSTVPEERGEPPLRSQLLYRARLRH